MTSPGVKAQINQNKGTQGKPNQFPTTTTLMANVPMILKNGSPMDVTSFEGFINNGSVINSPTTSANRIQLSPQALTRTTHVQYLVPSLAVQPTSRTIKGGFLLGLLELLHFNVS